jgi:hypothetical protein
MGYGLDGQGSIPSKGKDFFLLHSVQTGSEAHPASYPIGAEVKNGAAISPLPICLHGMVLN